MVDDAADILSFSPKIILGGVRILLASKFDAIGRKADVSCSYNRYFHCRACFNFVQILVLRPVPSGFLRDTA